MSDGGPFSSLGPFQDNHAHDHVLRPKTPFFIVAVWMMAIVTISGDLEGHSPLACLARLEMHESHMGQLPARSHGLGPPGAWI